MPNEFRIGRSARYAALSTLVHAGAAVIAGAAVARTSPALTLIVVALLAIALRRDLALVAVRSARDAVVSIEVREGRWWLRRRDGRSFGPATLETLRSAAAGVLLVLRDDGGVCVRVSVPADAVHGTDLRHIRVHARAAAAGVLVHG